MTYFCSILGVLRAGFIVFPISPRNSPEAVAHLLARTKANVLFTNASTDAGIQNVVTRAMQRLHDDGEAAPPMHSLPVFEDLFPSHAEKLQAKAIAPFRAWDAGQAMFIMHSSGMHTSRLSVGSGLTST